MKNINNKEVKCLKDENVRKEFNIKEFSFNKLTKEIFDNIKKEDLTAVFYAEGGAMGYSGLTMIVINEMNVYYSGLIGEEDDLSQIEILNSQLAVYRSDSQFDTNVDAFTSMEIAKKEYETLNAELRKKLKEANELIKNCKTLLDKQGTNFEKQVNKEINRMKSWN